MAATKTVRLVNRTTGSVVSLPPERAKELADRYRTLGFQPEGEHTPGRRLLRKEFSAAEKASGKTPAKKAAAKKSSK